jgi:hypothetical protein
MEQTERIIGTFRALATIILLVLALAMIALSVSVTAQSDFTRVPHLADVIKFGKSAFGCSDCHRFACESYSLLPRADASYFASRWRR